MKPYSIATLRSEPNEILYLARCAAFFIVDKQKNKPILYGLVRFSIMLQFL